MTSLSLRSEWIAIVRTPWSQISVKSFWSESSQPCTQLGLTLADGPQDTQHNNKQSEAFNITALSIMAVCFYAERHWWWVLQISVLCWVSSRWVLLCWVTLCWVSARWVSLCWVSLCWVSFCWVSWRHSDRLNLRPAHRKWVGSSLSYKAVTTQYRP
jgi:hypothetical protein